MGHQYHLPNVSGYSWRREGVCRSHGEDVCTVKQFWQNSFTQEHEGEERIILSHCHRGLFIYLVKVVWKGSGQGGRGKKRLSFLSPPGAPAYRMVLLRFRATFFPELAVLVRVAIV